MSGHSHADLDNQIAALRSALGDLEPPITVDAAIERAIRGRASAQRRARIARAAVVPLAIAATIAGIALVNRSLLAPERSAPALTDASTAAAPARTESGGTAFVPLVSLAELEHTRETLVVAMQLPRTSLTEFGVAVNPARAADSVPTELLIRPDGAVLAIRFVQ